MCRQQPKDVLDCLGKTADRNLGTSAAIDLFVSVEMTKTEDNAARGRRHAGTPTVARLFPKPALHAPFKPSLRETFKSERSPHR